MELIIHTAKHTIRMDSEDWDLRKSKVTGRPKRLAVDNKGYVHFGKYYSQRKDAVLHRLIIERVLGRPLIKDEVVDHQNGDKLDNRSCNLRVVTNRQNHQNLKIHREGRLVGCHYHKQAEKWRARLQINGKRQSLGLFTTEAEAHEAYLKALDDNSLSYINEV